MVLTQRPFLLRVQQYHDLDREGKLMRMRSSLGRQWRTDDVIQEEELHYESQQPYPYGPDAQGDAAPEYDDGEADEDEEDEEAGAPRSGMEPGKSDDASGRDKKDLRRRLSNRSKSRRHRRTSTEGGGGGRGGLVAEIEDEDPNNLGRLRDRGGSEAVGVEGAGEMDDEAMNGKSECGSVYPIAISTA